MKQIIQVLLYQPLYNILIFLAWLIPGHSIGWAIIGVTLLIRLILVPSTNKSFRAQKHLRDLQPKMDAVREKYKGNKEEQTKATMALYKEHNVNPLGSCLPLLIQFPILLVLYQVFTNGLNTSQFNLLYSFVPHLDTINTFFFGINLAQPDRWVLPIITGIFQFIQMRQMQVMTGMGNSAAGDKTQDMAKMMNKQMMYLMPLITVLFAAKLPAALPLYWLATTLFAIIQQWWFLRNTDMTPAVVTVDSPSTNKTKAISAPKKSLLSQIKSIRKSDVTVTVRRKGE